LEKQPDPHPGSESKARLVEQINTCLRAGDYARALDLLRSMAAGFRKDAELSELEKLAHDGVKRNAEANRLITESQELFAQQKSVEAIQLLRQAYELDQHNSLARAILANALVEHANSMVETDWWQAETLAKQALDLIPTHPTARTIRGLVLERKKASSVDEWVLQAGKLQSSSDLFAALARVEEGMAAYPDDPKLLQIQDSIQRDQGARRRQSRRRDMEDLRRMEKEIDGAADVLAQHALAERIQGVAAKYWTDGEFLSVANGLLHRLGLVPQGNSAAPSHSKSAPVIFHVPRTSAPKASSNDSSPSPPSQVSPSQASNVPAGVVVSGQGTLSQTLRSATPPVEAPSEVQTTPAEPAVATAQAVIVPTAGPSAPSATITSPSPQPAKRPEKSSFATLIFLSAAAIVLIAATVFFFVRSHQASPVVKSASVAPTAVAPAVPAPPQTTPAEIALGPSLPAEPIPSGIAEKVTAADQPPADSGHNQGTLLVVAGQDGARVFLDGQLQPQITQGGQLRLTNLELKDYLVQVSKLGFQDPPQQRVRIRAGEQAGLIFKLEAQNLQPQILQAQNLQPQPRLASLSIQGGTSETTVFIDQRPAGAVQSDGTLSLSNLNAGDHTIELRKERFKPRQFKKQFVAGGTVSLNVEDAALEAAPGELKINFTPADASVAVVKGDLLKTVSSGVPLNLVPGTYTLTARTAERFTRSATLEVVAGQPKTVDLFLAPNGMSKWDDPGAWKHEGDSYIRKGGDFVLYGVAPCSGTFAFSAMPAKGHLLQWVFNYSDPKNYILFQMDDNNFYRAVIRNGQKTDEIKVPDKSDKKSLRSFQIRVSPTEIVHQIKHGDRWSVLDRWSQPGANLSLGKFGLYIPASDQVAISNFSHFADLNIR
jgi:tetratricopeptide (TPR) repeat protein